MTWGGGGPSLGGSPSRGAYGSDKGCPKGALSNHQVINGEYGVLYFRGHGEREFYTVNLPRILNLFYPFDIFTCKP